MTNYFMVMFAKPGAVTNLAGLASLLLLALVITFSPAKLCYDESYHLDVAKNASDSGWHQALTSPNNGSAAGPLFAAVHVATAGITGFHPPAVRWVNFVCLVIVVALVAMSCLMCSNPNPWISGLSILSVPFLWPSVGMALTEMPALTAFSIFIFCIVRLLKNPHGEITIRSLGWAILAGLGFGLAIMGRQTYLIVTPAIVILLFTAPKRKHLWLACLLVSFVCCGWLFFLWKGLVPPSQQHVGGNMRIDHGVLSLSYVTAATFFINPTWLRPKSIKTSSLLISLGIVSAWLIRDYSSPPAKSLLLRLFGEPFGLAVGFAVGAMLISASILWLSNTVVLAWADRFDPLRVFLFLTLFALVAAPIKVSHLFSSRYVVGLLGVLIMVIGVPQSSSRWLVLRIATGSLIGAATLWTYYIS